MAKKHHHMELRGNVWYFIGRRPKDRHRYHVPLFEDENASMDKRDDYIKEIRNYGEIVSLKPLEVKAEQIEVPQQDLLFGQVAKMWAEVHEVASSTMTDYKCAMNTFVLPAFGNVPINDIRKLDIQAFRKKLTCSEKRKNNIFVPLRCVFRFAHENELMDKNIMSLVKNLKVKKPDIFPLSMNEVIKFLDCVEPYYRNFFEIAFFTGMRFGEMAVLKWSNVDLDMGIIKVRETLVRKEEKIPKTESSNRDIKISKPVREALIEIKKNCPYKTEYVFVNKEGRHLLPRSINFHIWHPALKKAELNPRSLYQTRHTYATLMLDGGEHPGWVSKQMGHVNSKMLFDKYYNYIKNYKNDDGEAFMKNVYEPVLEGRCLV